MSLSIISRPSKTISGETSVWNAVGNPIIYDLRREDFDWNQINNNGGFMQVQFNSIDLSDQFSIGDTVYVKSSNGVYDLTATVTGVSFSTNTLVNLDEEYGSSSGGGGYINNVTTRPGYSAYINVYDGDDELINESPFIFSPDFRGDILVNVSAIIRPTLLPDNNFVIGGGHTQNDSGVFTPSGFYIEYLEDWTGNNESLIYQTDSVNIFFAVLGANQIPASYGGNLAEYVIWQDSAPQAKFLQLMNKPVIWKDWPAFICTIHDVGTTIEMEINDGVSGVISNTTSPSQKLVMWDLYTIINSAVTDLVIGDLTVTIEQVSGSPATKTESLIIDYRESCKNGIMLLGRNHLGGVIQWLFEYSQEYTFDYGNDRKARRMVLHTDSLTINQWEALQDFITLGQVYRDNILELTSDTIKTSTRVGQQVYIIEQDGTKTGVIVIPTKNQTKTKKYSHEFEIEIEYPEVFAV